jgi:hypothetical protein
LPEGEEDNGLDGEKLEHRVVLGEQLLRGGVEEDQAIEGNSNGEVVGKGAVEVAILWAVHVGHGVCVSMHEFESEI